MRSLAMVGFCVVLLLLAEVPPVEGSLPELTRTSPDLGGPVGPSSGSAGFPNNRLPGVCRRLRRRRITVLCNSDKFCSRPGRPVERRSGGSSPGQSCRCPRASRCSHVFIRSFL